MVSQDKKTDSKKTYPIYNDCILHSETQESLIQQSQIMISLPALS